MVKLLGVSQLKHLTYLYKGVDAIVPVKLARELRSIRLNGIKRKGFMLTVVYLSEGPWKACSQRGWGSSIG